MKRIIPILTLSMIVMLGCKSNKNTVVNSRPELDKNTVWVLTEIRGNEVTYSEGQQKATIRINPEAKLFDGDNGCNHYSGKFKDLGDGKMNLTDIIATKMACPESFKLESSFMSALQKCDNYNLGEYTLELKQGDKVMLTFEKTK